MCACWGGDYDFKVFEINMCIREVWKCLLKVFLKSATASETEEVKRDCLANVVEFLATFCVILKLVIEARCPAFVKREDVFFVFFVFRLM